MLFSRGEIFEGQIKDQLLMKNYFRKLIQNHSDHFDNFQHF